MTHFNIYKPASKNFNIGGRPDGHTDGHTDGRTDRNRYYIGSLLLRSSPKRSKFYGILLDIFQDWSGQAWK